MRLSSICAAAIAAGLALASPASAQTPAPDVAARIDSVFARYTPATPGCGVMVREHGAPVFERAYGLASLDLHVPITAQTVFMEAALAPEDFGEYAGRYRTDELGVAWEVVADSGRVLLRDERGSDTPLVPIFRDGFDGPGTVRFERNSSGAVCGMIFTTRGIAALSSTRLGGPTCGGGSR